MPHVDLVKRVAVPSSFRVAAIQGMFDIPRQAEDEFRLKLDVPIEDAGAWKIGAIVGASGMGKSSLAQHLFGEVFRPDRLDWADGPIIDRFPTALSVDEIARLLTSVGLSSVPSWQRPYAVLSTGEQFRASMALLLAGEHEPIVVDEFTSVVDRTVARAVSVAVSRHIRRSTRRLVVVSCHRDIVPWLEPDWVVDLDDRRFLRPDGQRPAISLRIYPSSVAAWDAFKRHHYMTGAIHPSASCFLGTVTFSDDGMERPCAFTSLVPRMGIRGWRRFHRTVVLPDFQGLGIGNAFLEAVAEWFWTARGLRVSATTSARPLIHYRRQHPEKWRCVNGPTMQAVSRSASFPGTKTSAGRLTTSWEYIPAGLRDEPDAVQAVGAGVEAPQRRSSLRLDVGEGDRLNLAHQQGGKWRPRADGCMEEVADLAATARELGTDGVGLLTGEDRGDVLLLKPERAHV